jgi:hypothetical protein
MEIIRISPQEKIPVEEARKNYLEAMKQPDGDVFEKYCQYVEARIPPRTQIVLFGRYRLNLGSIY